MSCFLYSACIQRKASNGYDTTGGRRDRVGQAVCIPGKSDNIGQRLQQGNSKKNSAGNGGTGWLQQNMEKQGYTHDSENPNTQDLCFQRTPLCKRNMDIEENRSGQIAGI